MSSAECEAGNQNGCESGPQPSTSTTEGPQPENKQSSSEYSPIQPSSQAVAENSGRPSAGSNTLTVSSSVSTLLPGPVAGEMRRSSSAREWEEVDHSEIEILKTIGHGAYGVVKKANWRGKLVAVKYIENESAIKDFAYEVKQLSRVHHPNIVKLYGACLTEAICLLMEYAEDGSLYNLLHSLKHVTYTAGHAVSWVYQCAKGVAHLHDLKMVHRDLKPPNLLLSQNCRKVKICDFGTVTDLKTYMTNNKGSAAWMAPEVFEGRKYSDKCDSFSWGIILWEALARRKPFEEIGGGPFTIMWAVHQGRRPPLIIGCPKPLELLMKQCWQKDPDERPPMKEILSRMTAILPFFTGGDEAIVFPDQSSDVKLEHFEIAFNVGDTNEDNDLTIDSCNRTQTQTFIPNDPGPDGEPVPLFPPASAVKSPIVTEEVDNKMVGGVQQSAPPSLASSRENLIVQHKSSVPALPHPTLKQKYVGHKRTGSWDPNLIAAAQKKAEEKVASRPYPQEAPGPGPIVSRLRGASAAGGIDGPELSKPRPRFVLPIRKVTLPGDGSDAEENGADPGVQSPTEMLRAYSCIDPHLQPFPPDPKNSESMDMFFAHCGLADEYIRVMEEIELLSTLKQDLIDDLQNSIREDSQNIRLQDDYSKMVIERDKLRDFRAELKMKLDRMKPTT